MFKFLELKRGTVTDYSVVLGRDRKWVAELLADVPVADRTMKQPKWYARDVARTMVAMQKNY